MGKKYVPSGYQIIEIDISRLDKNKVLPVETEDEKVLHETFINNKLQEKPILLNVKNDGDILLSGFATSYNNRSLFLSGIYAESGSLDTAFSAYITYDSTNDKIVVKYSEL